MTKANETACCPVIPIPDIDMEKTGNRIKQLRKDFGYGVEDIQEWLNMSYPEAIYQWQRGKSLPSIEHLLALSHLFNCSINDILVLKGQHGDTAKAATDVVQMMAFWPA